MASVFVTGATGFIGEYVCRALVEAGYDPVGLTRSLPEGERRLEGVTYAVGDVTEPTSIAKVLPPDCAFVVHLVGIIAENKSKGQTFERVHVEGTRAVVKAAQAAEMARRPDSRFVHVSAQGADSNSSSEYSRTKARAEEIVRASQIPYTILRPSLVLGPNGDFARQMEQLIRRPPLSPVPLPFVPVPGNGLNRFQPVWVGDLAHAIVRSLDAPGAANQIIPVGGHDPLTFNALLNAFQARLNVKKPLLHAPLPLMHLAASFLEAVLSIPPVTRDQLANLKTDNVTDLRLLRQLLGIEPLGFEEMLNQIYGKA